MDIEIGAIIKALPKAPYIDIKMALIDIYESKSGIYDHLNPNSEKLKPMASVAMHDCEDITTTTHLYQTIEIYFDREIYKYTGLTIIQFLSLPREFTSLIIKQIIKTRTRENNDAQNIINSLGPPAGKTK